MQKPAPAATRSAEEASKLNKLHSSHKQAPLGPDKCCLFSRRPGQILGKRVRGAEKVCHLSKVGTHFGQDSCSAEVVLARLR
jgi:hypothetical protein